MRMRLCSIVLGSLILFVLAADVRAGQAEPPMLRSTGVAAGDPEQVLPGGAVVHVRAHNPAALIKSLDELIVSFVPEKALPPQLQAALKQPTPTLALLGMNAQGQVLTIDQLGQMFGLAPDRPVTLTLYVGETGPTFVLSLPMKDPRALTGLLMNALAPRRFAPSRTPNGELFDIVGTNPDLPPRLFVACSEDRAYICSSPAMAAGLTGDAPRLAAASPLVADALKQHGKEDLTAIIDPGVFKPLLAMLQERYATLPPQEIQQLRRQLLRGIPPSQKANLDLRLRWQFGIDGVEQGLDYLEALATGSYEVLFGYFAGQVQALEGVVVSVDVGQATQKLRVVLHSAAIKPAECAQPLPMADVRTALGKFPGSRDLLTISGRRQPAKVSPLLIQWMDKLKAKFTEKKLPLEGLARLSAYLQGYRESQPLETQIPWTVEADLNPPATSVAAAPSTIVEYVQQLFARPGATTLTMMPAQKEDFIEKHFVEEARSVNANEKSYHGLSEEKSLFDVSARCQIDPLEGGLKKVTYENIYTSNFSLFGYSEHELINRKMIYYARQGDCVFMQQGTRAGGIWVNRLDKLPATPLPAALTKMLDQVPPDAVAARTIRILHQLPAAVTQLGAMENMIHDELDAYLAQARKVLKAEADNREKLEAKLQAIQPPLLMMALCADPVNGELYLVLPGNLRYPRPKVVPALADLVKAYSAQADALGGSLEYERVGNGEYEMTVAVNTDALAFLVKSAVNAYVETYAVPGGEAKLRQLLVKPGDGLLQRNQVVIFNTLWGFLYEQRGARLPIEDEM